MNLRFAHTNIVSTDWKKLAAVYVNVFDCTILPPVRNLSGAFLDRGTGLKNAKLQGAHLSLPGYDKRPLPLKYISTKKLKIRKAYLPIKEGMDTLPLRLRTSGKYCKTF